MTEIDPILINDWYIVSKAEDIQYGKIKPITLLGENIVVWRGSSPESPIVAWQDWCPHRGVALSFGKVVGDQLSCGYHGWQYDKTGKCAKIPSLATQPTQVNASAKTYKCKESGGVIWVSLGNPIHDVPNLPEWDNPDYHQFIFGPYYVNSSPFRVIENNLDLSHVPFLHEVSLGDPDYPIIEDYEVKTEKDSITFRNLSLWQLNADYTDTKTIIKTNFPFIKIDSPLSVRGIKTIENSSKITSWGVNVTPIEEDSCLFWITYAMNYESGVSEEKVQISIDKLLREDVFILESHRPKYLPLLPRKNPDSQWQPESHAPCDKGSIAYRKWLHNLGITFGVC